MTGSYKFYRATRRIWVRAGPSTSAERRGSLSAGDVVGVASVELVRASRWARLVAEELNFLDSSHSVGVAWVLIDGAALGLPQLLIPVSEEDGPPLVLYRLPHQLTAEARRTGMRAMAPTRIACYDRERWRDAPAATSSFGAREYLCYWRLPAAISGTKS